MNPATVALSHCRTVALSHCRSVALSLCRSVALSLCRSVALSLCRPSKRLAVLLFATGITAPVAEAATITLDSQPIPGGYRLTATEEVSSYIILQISSTLTQLTPLAMDMGAGGAVWDVPAARTVEAEGVNEDKTYRSLKACERKADTAAAAEVKGFRRAKIPAGFKADLWATEPLLANPVAFSFDGKGRMFIAETHRYRTSVLDIRDYMFMLEDNLANRNQADWERSIKKNSPNDWQELGKESEVVRLMRGGH